MDMSNGTHVITGIYFKNKTHFLLNYKCLKAEWERLGKMNARLN